MSIVDTEEFDFVILGSGEAGKYLAWNLGKEGKRVAVIERRWVGGSCPNIACLPSKNFVHTAKVASYVRNSKEFGISAENFSVNMAAVRDRKRKMVEELVEVHVVNYKASKTDLVIGSGKFVKPKTIEVALTDGGTRVLHGEKVVICTGSRASIDKTPGLKESKPLTHIELLELDRVPEHLLVVGGGYIGLEFAQTMRRFGSRVTIIERNDRLAHREDPDVSEIMHDVFSDEGVEILTSTNIKQVEGTSGKSVTMRLEKDGAEIVVQGTHILTATGRTPNTDGIGLELAGVELTERGHVKVNERLETSAPGVWAVGDCAGSPLFTHIGFDDFRVVRDNIAGKNHVTTGRQVPFCLFTDPELARCGLSETEAKAKGIAYRLAKIPMTTVLRAQTIGETKGFMKALIDIDSDRILGFTAFGPDAGELIAAIQIVMLANLPYTILRDAVLIHPTMVEGFIPLFSKVPVKAPATV